MVNVEQSQECVSRTQNKSFFWNEAGLGLVGCGLEMPSEIFQHLFN